MFFKKNIFDYQQEQFGSITSVNKNIVTILLLNTQVVIDKVLFRNPCQFGANKGMLYKPYVGMIVKYYSLYDNTPCCEPVCFNDSYNKVPDTFEEQVSEVGNYYNEVADGDLLISNGNNVDILFSNTGTLDLSDELGNSIFLDLQQGITNTTSFSFNVTLDTSFLNFGIPKRDYIDSDLVTNNLNVSSLTGYSSYNCFDLNVVPSQTLGLELLGYRIQIGDIFSDLLPYTLDALNIKSEVFTDVSGITQYEETLSRVGTLTRYFGVSGVNITETYNNVTGTYNLKDVNTYITASEVSSLTMDATHIALESDAKISFTASSVVLNSSTIQIVNNEPQIVALMNLSTKAVIPITLKDGTIGYIPVLSL